MFRRCVTLFAAGVFCWPVVGCGGPKPPELEKTFPVTGVIHIDGKPTEGVLVMLFKAAEGLIGFEINTPPVQKGTTGPDGKFAITTYNEGDGAPVGEYHLAFHWPGNPKIPPLSNPDEIPVDPIAVRFNGNYANPSRNSFLAKVEEGKPVDLGTLDLKSK